MLFVFCINMKQILFFFIWTTLSCSAQQENSPTESTLHQPLLVGAEQPQLYLPLLQGKRVAVVTNQTGILPQSKISKTANDLSTYNIHVVDYLLDQSISVQKIFAPEHGFRGIADAGEKVSDDIDSKTGLPIISLYGNHKKPSASQLQDVDIIVFDMQDVGLRFFTYISTLSYVMESAAKEQIPVIVFDRPNPNTHYIDGPVLRPEYKSFVGLHPVPVVYGMTIGEYAQMVNGEGWLENGLICDLTVIPVRNYTHDMFYSLPVKPSPNLPNDQSIRLYPSLCFFEGTNVSVGRGTDMQFQVYGSPYLTKKDFSFVPMPNLGASNPKHQGETCFGENLQLIQAPSSVDLSFVIKAYQSNASDTFFNKNLFFDKLAGNKELRLQIQSGKTQEQIKETWQAELEIFKKIREKYLIYN